MMTTSGGISKQASTFSTLTQSRKRTSFHSQTMVEPGWRTSGYLKRSSTLSTREFGFNF